MEIRASIEPAWSMVRQVRDEIGQRLTGVTPSVRQAAQMVASELLENAVKYGEAVPAAPNISFVFTADESGIHIEVTNGCTATGSVERLRARIAELGRATNLDELYIRRLEALMDQPSASSAGLGIYRIGLEGAFQLSADYTDDVVSVRATRSVT